MASPKGTFGLTNAKKAPEVSVRAEDDGPTCVETSLTSGSREARRPLP
jgi:hypothetical protein